MRESAVTTRNSFLPVSLGQDAECDIVFVRLERCEADDFLGGAQRVAGGMGQGGVGNARGKREEKFIEGKLMRHEFAVNFARGSIHRVVPDAEALSRLLVDAGFHEVHIRSSRMRIRLPSLETFVLCHLAAMPVADAVAALSDETRAVLARDVCLALQPYADGDSVVVPNETSLATAHT